MITLLITSLITTLLCTILMVSGALIQYYGLSALIRSWDRSTGTRTEHDNWMDYWMDYLYTTLFLIGCWLIGLSIGIAISAAFGYLLPLVNSHWTYS